MSNITFQNIVNIFLDRVPELKKTESFDEKDLELPHVFFGNFANFLLKRIEKTQNPAQDEIIRKTFSFLNEVFNAPKTEWQKQITARIRSNDKFSREEMEKISLEPTNLLGIEFFESFVSSKKTIDVAQKLLKDDALESFEETMQYFKK